MRLADLLSTGLAQEMQISPESRVVSPERFDHTAEFAEKYCAECAENYGFDFATFGGLRANHWTSFRSNSAGATLRAPQ